jgi:hypothetical protein
VPVNARCVYLKVLAVDCYCKTVACANNRDVPRRAADFDVVPHYSNRGSAPDPGSIARADPTAPLRSLAGALCAPPFCGNENGILIGRRITD